MRTLKVVVIGDSGVGKTSLRGQYVSGRFSMSYRATIGADFISKTLPHHAHPTDPSEQVTLQIWDTAGQERFSSLSAAFFRGADAAVLMFDVSRPETLHSLRKWWDEFRERAPVPDDDGGAFCAVFVGNKVDVVPEGEQMAVGRDEARAFVDELVPRAEDAEDGDGDAEDGDGDEREPERPLSLAVSAYEDAEDFTSDPEPESDTPYAAPSSSSIQIRAKRRSLLGTNTNTGTNAGNASTLSSVRTGRTAFYTPSSSVFTTATTAPSQSFESARSSFSPSPARKRSSSARRTSLSPPPNPPARRSRPSSPSLSPRRKSSLSSLSTAATITPSLFTRTHDNGHTTPPTPPLLSSSSSPSSPSFPPPPPPLEMGAALFFASAKSGEGVKDVFEYVARRVVRRWEAEEASEARTMHVFEGSVGDGVVRLREEGRGRGRELWRRGTCCAV